MHIAASGFTSWCHARSRVVLDKTVNRALLCDWCTSALCPVHEPGGITVIGPLYWRLVSSSGGLGIVDTQVLPLVFSHVSAFLL